MIVATKEEIENEKLSFSDHCVIILRAFYIIPMAFVVFTVNTIAEFVKIPNRVVHALTITTIVKRIAKRKNLV